MELKVTLPIKSTIKSLDDNLALIKNITDLKDMKDQNLFFHTINDELKKAEQSYKEQKKLFEDKIKLYKSKLEEIKNAHKTQVLKLLNENNQKEIKGYYGYSKAKIINDIDFKPFEEFVLEQFKRFLVQMENPIYPDSSLIKKQRMLELVELKVKTKTKLLTEADLELFAQHTTSKTVPPSVTMLSSAYKKSK